MFKNKKFRARSRRRNLTREIESIRVQTTHAERKPRKKQHEPVDYTFSQNQYEDYLTLNGIVNRTGIAKGDSYTFILKELLDNAVDDVEKSNNPLVEAEISMRNNLLYLIVRNFNESNKVVFSKAKLDSIFNLSRFTSSKRGLFRISRGALGDAMKYVLGMPFALAIVQTGNLSAGYTPDQYLNSLMLGATI